MSTPFSFEYLFRASSVRTLIDAYFNDDHLAAQDKVAQLGDRVIVENHETDAMRKTTWRVTSLRPPLMIMRPFVTNGRLTYLESMSWNRTNDAVQTSVAPEILGGRVQIAGAYELTQIAEGQIRRIYTGSITAAITFLSRKIERGILEAFKEQMPALADCTQGWLDRQ